MNMIAICFAFVTAFTWGKAVFAQDMRNMSILTGLPTGTYYRFGQDIRAVVEQECGTLLEVRESQGSISSLYRLRHEKFAQLAIVQVDALEFLKLGSEDNFKLKDSVDNFRYVYRLYPEEVHLLTRKDTGIRNFLTCKAAA